MESDFLFCGFFRAKYGIDSVEEVSDLKDFLVGCCCGSGVCGGLFGVGF